VRVLWTLFSGDREARWERALIRASLFRLWSAYRRGISIGSPIWAVRTDITTTKLTLGGATGTIANDIAEIAGTTIDAGLVTAGVRILFNKVRKVVVRITNTQAATHVVTVVRGNAQDNPAADYASTAIPATTGVRIFTFQQKSMSPDGQGIFINLDTGHTGVIQAYELP
jgi:hypothetical protein